MNIKLSTIIPVFNEEAYIDECMNSVRDAIKKNPAFDILHELIIVSDGASDSVLSRIAKYEQDFKNFKIINSEHRGVAATRNLGLKEASGKYVTFIDADDRLCDDFYLKSYELLDQDEDLFIFSIKRYEGDKLEYWKVNDKIYNSNVEFADDYIRNRNLLIYSNWNKFYKLGIIRDNNIKFDESIEFGEDRLFNYEYLRHVKTIITSSIFKNEYIKRSEASLSTRYHKNYFSLILKLHKEKMKCFIDLSSEASLDEIKDFVSYDLTNEIDKAIARFALNKEEEKENIDLINSICFEKPDEYKDDLGIIIILGSNNCGYKVEKALELCENKNDVDYIVSGGNMHMNKTQTEAEFMADMLTSHGIPKDKVHIENLATNTFDNLEYSFVIAKELINKNELENKKIGILTSGFHLKRTKALVRKYFREYLDCTSYYRAFGPIVQLDNWYKSDEGKTIIYNEIRKNIYEDFDEYKKFLYS